MKTSRRPLLSAVLLAALIFPMTAFAAETETLYLTGKGKDDPVQWDFMCSAGMKAGEWSKIGVPSNWELQGFGIYTYGTQRPNPWPKVRGEYKRTFTTPANWNGKTVNVVFEGVMTDTQVKINGQSAGDIHQGGYYRFKHDITKLLKPAGTENVIEVTVDDESANQSVNNAERRGDYWNYAGIFRPVYLEALPQTHIQHVAINATADGAFSVDVPVSFNETGSDVSLGLKVRDPSGNFVDAPTSSSQPPALSLRGKVASPKLWTAETPNLYTMEIQLSVGGKEVHTIQQKFGFRTIETRPGEGLFVNGKRIMLKGANRHSFWPDSGRCLSPEVSKMDIALMKEMNMNAVRMSHYPPDAHFLDLCDEMGLYVLDELAGWHQRYDTPSGTKLVKEMVMRDVNHPSILFWDNGNEGGWNTALDGEFAKYDPQKRLVLHPWDPFPRDIIDTKHYPDFNLLNTRLNGNAVFFPTEMLHGLYDGGHGAGLEEYWNAIMKAKASAGGFLWVLSDESLKRVDQGGKLDTSGNQAPDGIVGPYREKEGSFYTIKELWSPIWVRDKTMLDLASFESGVGRVGGVLVENRYDFIDLQDCRYVWELRKASLPTQVGGSNGVRAGTAKTYAATVPGQPQTSSIPPHQMGTIIPDNASVLISKPDADLFVLRAFAPSGKEINSWTLPLRFISKYRELATAPGGDTTAIAEADTALTATAGDLSLKFDKKTGLLTAASRAGKNFSLLNGPRFVATRPTPAPAARGSVVSTPPALPQLEGRPLTDFTQKTEGDDLVITASYASKENPEPAGMKSITYRLRPNGWLTVDYAYTLTGPHEYFGVGFDYPEANVQSMRYLGNGPSTVYQNRLAGGTLDVWEKKYNNTIVGDPADLKPGELFDYPIFKGYYAGMRWLQLKTSEGPITALLNQDDLFVQILTPKTPPQNQIGQTGVAFPQAGLSFLHAIPAIGSKFNGPRSTGPQGQPAAAKGEYKGCISLYFGDLR